MKKKLRAWLRQLFRPRHQQPDRPAPARTAVPDSPDAPPRDLRVEPEREPRRKAARELQLGVDFGTAWSKLVLRDLSGRGGRPYAEVVAPGSSDYRVPSLACVDDGQLFLGLDARARAQSGSAQLYESLKMQAAFPQGFFGAARPLPDGFTAKDVATLLVASLLQTGWGRAKEFAHARGSDPRVSFTLGVPVSYLDEPAARETFFDIAVDAFSVRKEAQSDLLRPLTLARGRELLIEARRNAPRADERGAIEQWLRPETTSALMWAFQSPAVDAGLYAAVDIGAGTTNASFFSITSELRDGSYQKCGMAFFGAFSRPPGLDKLGRCLCPSGAHLSSIRGREDELIRSSKLRSAHVARVLAEFFETYRGAFSRAFSKDPRQFQWEHYGLFFLGGGSKVRAVVDRLQAPVVPSFQFDLFYPEAEPPADLHDSLGRPWAQDHTFLLVAYGLSFSGLEVPFVEQPSEVPELKLEQKQKNPCVYWDEYDGL